MNTLVGEDTIYISYAPFLGLRPERMAGLYEISSNTLCMTGQCRSLVPKVLKSLRHAQRKYGIEVSPVKVEYW